MAARLMHKIGQELGKTLPLAMLFESPTIEQLADALSQDGWSRYWSSLVPIQPSGSKPPFFCVHGVGGNVIGLRELRANAWALTIRFMDCNRRVSTGSVRAHSNRRDGCTLHPGD